jgi:hypothetical protein
VDDFARASQAVNCSPFHKEETIEWLGYDPYFDDTEVELTRYLGKMKAIFEDCMYFAALPFGRELANQKVG